METILALPLIGPFLGVVVPFIVVLSIVIFVHEYGHYIVGRWSGIHAEAFSIGFGREIFGWTDKRGTRWKVSWLPLGGYVKFKGDANEASAPEDGALEGMSAEERRSTMQGAPLWARSATVAAGPIANFLLTILLFIALALAIGKPTAEPVLGDVTPGGQAYGGGLRSGDRVISVEGVDVETYGAFQQAMLEEEARPKTVVVERAGEKETLALSFSRLTRVADVSPGGPAALACIEAGDVIQKIDGQTVTSFVDIQDAVTRSDGAPMAVTVQRGAELRDVTLEPRVMEHPDPATGAVTRKMMIGVIADFNIGVAPANEPVGLLEAVSRGVEAPWRIAQTTFGYLGAIFAGQADGSSLGGPLGIADASGRAAERGFIEFVALIATLSTAIGLINLFPIPILDGGHLVFYAIEGVIGRPLSARYVEAAMTAGFVAILALLVFATSNDVPRILGPLASGC